MINIINEKKKENEVVRVGIKTFPNEFDKSPASTASHILRSLIMDDKQVYIKYIAEGKNSALIESKVLSVLRILKRMSTEPLEAICGDYSKIPEKYLGKKIVVLTGLPYTKDTVISTIKKDNGNYIKNNEKTEEDKEIVKTATIIKFYLALEESDN